MLCVTAAKFPEISFAPQLPPAAELLLSFVSEEDAFAIMSLMIRFVFRFGGGLGVLFC